MTAPREELRLAEDCGASASEEKPKDGCRSIGGSLNGTSGESCESPPPPPPMEAPASGSAAVNDGEARAAPADGDGNGESDTEGRRDGGGGDTATAAGGGGTDADGAATSPTKSSASSTRPPPIDTSSPSTHAPHTKRTLTPVFGSPSKHGPNPPLKVLFLSSDTGGGHRASAESLAAQFLRLYPGSTYRLFDVVSECGVPPYNGLVGWYSHLSKNPAQWSLVYKVSNTRAFQAAADMQLRVLTERGIRRKIASAFVGEGAPAPDVVVSVHPLMNAVPAMACANLSQESGRHVPFFTVVTDLGSAHSMWFDRNVEKMFLASEQLRMTAIERSGVGEDKITMSGLPIRRDFAVQAEAMGEEGRNGAQGRVYRKRVRDGLGLLPGGGVVDSPSPSPSSSSICSESGQRKVHRVVLVMGGGEGCGALGPIVDSLYVELVRRGVESTVVVVCGRNEELRRSLAERDWHAVMERAVDDHPEEEEGRRAAVARRLRRIMSTPGRMESDPRLWELLRKADEEKEREERAEDEEKGGASEGAVAAARNETSAGSSDEEKAPETPRKTTYSWSRLRRQAQGVLEVGTIEAKKSGSNSSPTDAVAAETANDDCVKATEDKPAEEWEGYRAAAARKLRQALSYRSLTRRKEGEDKGKENKGEEENSEESSRVDEEKEGGEGVEVGGSDDEEVAKGGRDDTEEGGVGDEGERDGMESAPVDAAELGARCQQVVASDVPSPIEDIRSSPPTPDDGGAFDDTRGHLQPSTPEDVSSAEERTDPKVFGDSDNGTEPGWDLEPNGENKKGNTPRPTFSAATAGGKSRLHAAATAHVTVHPLGFVTRMAEYMVAADLLITKAGPGTIAEAASVGLPVLLTSFLPGQEEGNVDFVTDHGFGTFVPDTDPRGVAREAASWLSDPDRLSELGRRAMEAGCPHAAEEIVSHIGKSAARWKEINEGNARAYAHARQILRQGSNMVEGEKEEKGEEEGGAVEGKAESASTHEEKGGVGASATGEKRKAGGGEAWKGMKLRDVIQSTDAGPSWV